MLEHTGMIDCKPCGILVDTYSKLSTSSELVSNAIRALKDLTFTRPNIAYVVPICLYIYDSSSFSPCPSMKHILRYLYETLDYGVMLHQTSPASLVDYTDVDWGMMP